MNIEEMRKELKKLEELEQIATAAEMEYDKAPMDTEKEKAFDESYKAEYESFMKVSTALVELSKEKLNIKEARAIVRGKRERLKEILKIA